MHFKYHMSCCCSSAILQEYASSQSDWPGFNLRLTARSCTHLFALHIKDNPKAEHSITPCAGRCAHCTPLPRRSLVMPSGFGIILFFFFIAPSSNKPVLAKHSFALFGADVTYFACVCKTLALLTICCIGVTYGYTNAAYPPCKHTPNVSHGYGYTKYLLPKSLIPKNKK